MKRLRPSVLLLVVAVVGCTAPMGPENLDPGRRAAVLTADNRIVNPGFGRYTVTAIIIDGTPCSLSEKPITIVLSPGRHTVRFDYEPVAPLVCNPNARYYFEAETDVSYTLTSTILGSAGVSHRIAASDGVNVLKFDADRVPDAPPEPPSELAPAPPEAPLPLEMSLPPTPDSV